MVSVWCCDCELYDVGVRVVVVVVQDNLDVIDRLIDDAEAQYRNFQHPDPYIGKLSLVALVLSV